VGLHVVTAIALLALAGCGSSTGGGSAGRPAGAQPVVKEFDLPDKAGSTHELTVGPDGNVWVTQQTQAKLVRVTPRGGLRFFPLPANSGPHGIKFDRAGHLWLTLEFANAIAELDQEGRILNRYPIPQAGAGPHGLAVARDGSVWWTGKEGNLIGRLDPRTGRMRLFPLPHPGSFPIYIAEGCDGMYFTELKGSRLGRVTDQGEITEYPTPTPDSLPIAVAPRACRIWFSEESGHHFGVLDPRTSKLTEYRLPHPDEDLAGLAFDASGTLWIQYKEPDLIGRVGDGMRVDEFPIPTKDATMHRIILGPGGNMWFTELAADKVGYISTADAPR
jgi:virginiamycin B lyase